MHENTELDHLPSLVIESIIVMYRLIFAWLSFSRPFGINSALNPGSMEKTYTT